nr:ribonuclease H-like domain-containing protein [Tanacetum cinerariifolium]
MTGNISYLTEYEPYNRGYVSFGQGGCKITGKRTIKTECIVLGRNFKLTDDTNVLLRTPRRHNMYSIDLNNVVPHKDLTCLVAKASADECMLWHRRLGKQHKASCKTKLVNSVTKPFHTLHMDLFGPTSDETSGILRNFITEIENLKDVKNFYGLRLLLLLVLLRIALLYTHVYQMDVKSAFLYGTIDEEVYVMQPSGFQDPKFPAKVYKVEKTIVATSTTEVEYVAAASGCGQVLWIQNQLIDYGSSMPCAALSKEISSSILLL